MDYRELIERVLSIDIHESVSIYKDEIDTLSRVLFNRSCGTCENKRIETLVRIYKDKQNILTRLTEIMERNYELKKGVVMTLPSLGLTVSNTNLTDKIAEQILAYNPAAIGQFVKFPIKGEKAKEVEPKKVAPKKAATKK